MPAGDWISLREAAEVIGCPKRTALYYAVNKLIPAVMIDGFWLVQRKDAQQFKKPKRGRPASKAAAPEVPAKKPKGK
ncbi:MAG: hypothetical protein U0804_28575 [Gemmataceae bacterium]